MTHRDASSGPTIDIICSVLNGEHFLPDFFESLKGQTYGNWRLWLRDDGSGDRTVALFESAAAADARIQVLHVGGPRVGPAQSFGWVLERVPSDSAYIMTADADDVWLPHKIEHTLRAMLEAATTYGAAMPILVHTDLTVVESDLRQRHPSFWKYTDLSPEPATLRRVALRNPATGPTIMFNAALRARIGATPPEAWHHDWWYALVAAAVGRIVAIHESTVLYRQHGGNDVGAQPRGAVAFRRLPRAVWRSLARTTLFRTKLGKAARQAGVVLERYSAELSDADRAFLRDFANMPDRGMWGRKVDLLRLQLLPAGALRKIAALLRA